MAAGTRTHKITLIPGDGIGPEVSGAVVRIVESAGAATGVSFDWHTFAAGADAFAATGEYIPKALYESIEQNRVASGVNRLKAQISQSHRTKSSATKRAA